MGDRLDKLEESTRQILDWKRDMAQQEIQYNERMKNLEERENRLAENTKKTNIEIEMRLKKLEQKEANMIIVEERLKKLEEGFNQNHIHVNKIDSRLGLISDEQKKSNENDAKLNRKYDDISSKQESLDNELQGLARSVEDLKNQQSDSNGDHDSQETEYATVTDYESDYDQTLSPISSSYSSPSPKRSRIGKLSIVTMN